jgi:GT2 family glycosyltransferase
VHEFSAVTGACLAVEKSTFDSLTGWNEQLPSSYNDVDLCLRLNGQGFQSLICHDIEIIHNESSSRDSTFDEQAFLTLKKSFPQQLGSERYLRSEIALGQGYLGPWGIHKLERKDFQGRYIAYSWDLFISRGLSAVVASIWGRVTGRTARLFAIDSKRFL